MSTFPVKWATSAHLPRVGRLTQTPRAFINLMEDFLITGMATITPNTIVVANGVATVTVAVGDTFPAHMVVLVEGVGDPDLVGEFRVQSSSETEFTFATQAQAGTYTGGITIKLAPVGHWEKIYDAVDSHTVAFRSSHPHSTGAILVIHEKDEKTGVMWVGGLMHEPTMDAGYWQALVADYDLWVPHQSLTVPNGRGSYYDNGHTFCTHNDGGAWVLVGDPLALLWGFGPRYEVTEDPHSTQLSRYGYMGIHGFGDMELVSGGLVPLIAENSVNGTNSRSGGGFLARSNSSNGRVTDVETGGDVDVFAMSGGKALSGADPALGTLKAYETPVVTKVVAVTSRGTALVSGVAHLPMEVPASGPQGWWRMVGVVDMLGSAQMVVPLGDSLAASNDSLGVGFIDIVGPWRTYV